MAGTISDLLAGEAAFDNGAEVVSHDMRCTRNWRSRIDVDLARLPAAIGDFMTTPKNSNSGPAPHDAFSKTCASVLDSAARAMTDPHQWDTYLAGGAAEHVIAGDHQGRHWLELIQNARDAVYEGRVRRGIEQPGRVLVGTTEHGMVVANTGIPFELHIDKVLNAVQWFLRSTKQDTGTIGNRGVGLKSVLQRAEALQVRTHVGEHELRASFSRSRTARSLLGRLAGAKGIDSDLARALANLAGGVPEDELGPVSDPSRLLAGLPSLSLFQFPHADQEHPAVETRDHLLLEDLLHDEAPARDMPEGLDHRGQPVVLPAYTTVVYLPFADPDWAELIAGLEPLLDAKDLPRFEAAQRKIVDRPEDLAATTWKELLDLDPRVFVLLGEIAEVQLVRYEDQKLVEARRYEIEPALISGRRRERETLTLREQRWSVEDPSHVERSREMFVFSREREPEDDERGARGPKPEVRVVVDASIDLVQAKGQPLALYYPIDNAKTVFPFVAHGPFRLSSNRRDLLLDAAHEAYNLDVLADVEALAADGVAWLASGESPVRDSMPWLVCPAAQVEDGPLAAFQRGLLERMANLQLCPVGDGETTSPREALFCPEEPAAFSVLPQRAAVHQLCEASRGVYARWHEASPEAAAAACRALGLGRLLDDGAALVAALRESWKDTPSDRTHVDVDPVAARAWLRMLVDALTKQMKLDEPAALEAARSLGRHRIPTIPAHAEDGGRLVRVEDRTGDRGDERSWVLFYGEDDGEVETPPDPIPVYRSDLVGAPGATELIKRIGERWGAAEYRARPDLFFRVCERLGRRSSLELAVILWLAELLEAIERRPGKTTLRTRPYAGWNAEVVLKSVRDGNPRPLRLLHGLGAILLPDDQGETQAARTLSLGPAWAPYLQLSSDEDAAPEERWRQAIAAMDRFRQTSGSRVPMVAGPDDPAWGNLDSTQKAALARLLVALGVAVGPRLEGWWTRRTEWRHRAQTRPASREMSIYRSWKALQTAGDSDGPPTRVVEQMAQAVRLSANHSLVAGYHAGTCRSAGFERDEHRGMPATWTWFPDLVEVANWSEEACDAWVEAFLSVWPELSDGALHTQWVCTGTPRAHAVYHDTPIPSAALLQLRRAPIWLARLRGDQKSDEDDQRRRPAWQMVRWPDSAFADNKHRAETWLPALAEQPAIPEALRRALGMVSMNELAPTEAAARLGWLLGRRTGEELAPGVLALEEPGASWVAAVRLLTECLTRAMSDRIPDKPEGLRDRWFARDLALAGCWLRASLDGRRCAVRVVEDDTKGGRLQPEGAKVLSRTPRPRDRKGLVIEHAAGPEYGSVRRVAVALGATETQPEPDPIFPSEPIDPDGEAVDILRTALHGRRLLVLGTLRANGRGDLTEAAETLRALESSLLAVSREGPEGEWSGITQDNRLAFSTRAWKRERAHGGNGAHVLAEGFARALTRRGTDGQALAVDLGMALIGSPEFVRSQLRRRDADPDAIAQEIEGFEELRRRQADVWRTRLRALTETAGVTISDELLATARGGMNAADRLALLRAVLEHIHQARGDETTALEHRDATCFLDSDSAEALSSTSKAALYALAAAIVVARSPDLESEEALLGAALTVFSTVRRISCRAPGSGVEALLAQTSSRAHVNGRPLVVWTQEDWERLATEAQTRAMALLPEAPGPWHQVLKALIETPGPGVLAHHLRERTQQSKQEVSTLDWLHLDFDDEALEATPEEWSGHGSVVPIGGTRGGGKRTPVTQDQARRGLIAERFVLAGCWSRFMRLPPKQRGQLLDAVLAHREREEGAPWGDSRGAKHARDLLEEHRDALLNCTAENREAKQTFCKLLDVSTERWPGFDVIDPFGGRTDGPFEPGWLRRVEVKATATTDKGKHRVVFTTNEFHKARMEPESYVLRLVLVASADEPAGVRTLENIPNPVEALSMVERLHVGVRGGRLELRV